MTTTSNRVVHGLPLKRSQRVGPTELAYLEAGPTDGPTALFLHGFPTHGYLWRHVLRALAPSVHSLAPDLMGLGDTEVSPYGDFSPPAQAEMLLDWLDQRGIGHVLLVGHDQGGAVAQQLVANHPERVSHLLLIDTVTHDNWPIPMAAQVMRLARTPGLDTLAYALDLPRRLAHNARLGFRRAVWDPSVITDDAVDEYLRPVATAEGRERARRFLLAGDARFTLECLPGLRAYEGPATVLWGADDRFFSPSWGQLLVGELPGADRLELEPFCGHLVPEERPDAVVAAVHALLARPGRVGAPAGGAAGGTAGDTVGDPAGGPA